MILYKILVHLDKTLEESNSTICPEQQLWAKKKSLPDTRRLFLYFINTIVALIT